MKVGREASRQVLWTAGGASRLGWSAWGGGDGKVLKGLKLFFPDFFLKILAGPPSSLPLV